MEFKINLEEAYAQAFGVRRPIYVPVSKPILGEPQGYQDSKVSATEPIEFQNIKTLEIDVSSLKSSLGTQVLSPITFLGGSYKERLDNGQITNSDYDEFMLPPTSTVEVGFLKTVVKTPLRGGRGTFKEMIGEADARVRIRGILLGEDSKRPEQGIRSLYELNKVPSELSVVCDYLSWLGIDYLVIESLNFPDLQGKPNMQPFELNCISDKPIQLILNGG